MPVGESDSPEASADIYKVVIENDRYNELASLLGKGSASEIKDEELLKLKQEIDRRDKVQDEIDTSGFRPDPHGFQGRIAASPEVKKLVNDELAKRGLG